MIRPKLLRLLAFVSLALSSVLVSADQVVITTATITGTVRVGNLTMQSLFVQATSPGLSGSSVSVTPPPNSTVASYTLLVGIPQGTTPTFSVRPISVRTDNSRDVINLDPSNVVVNETAPSQADFDLANPGFIAATITVSGGGTLNSANVSASKGSQSASTNTQPINGFVFPVIANTGITVGGSASVFNGTNSANMSLTSQVVDVAPGQTVNVSFTVGTPPVPPPPPPNPTGSIAGTFQFTGSGTLSSATVFASGPTFRSTGVTGGSFLLSALAAGTYTMSATANLNSFDDTFSFPPNNAFFQPSRTVVVGTGQSTVDITAAQAYVNGALRLSGLSNLPDITSGLAFARNTTIGGQGRDTMAAATDTYDIIVTEGTWRLDLLQSLSLQRANPFLNQTISSFQDFRAERTITLAPQGTANMDFDWNVGEVAVRVALSNGGTLSSPRLSGSCTSAGQWTYSFSSQSNQVNVTEGRVSWVGPGGTCTVNGTIVVNGFTLSIPTQNLTIIPGVSQDLDAGGPALTVNVPQPGQIVSTNSLSVSGLASDDTAIASVTVNGLTAALTPTNNPSVPNEVSFQRAITLAQRGPNVVTTVARDVANPPKSTTDARTVYWDEAPPTVVFTPANGLSTFDASVTVTGTANDDAGIQRITVNGAQVGFSSTQNPSSPNEVSFSTSVSLSAGANAIVVAVTDISNRVTTDTHSVTRLTQRTTTLTADDATGAYGVTALLSARLLDQDGNPVVGRTISFTAFGTTLSGVTSATGNASVTLSLGGESVGSHSFEASFAGDESFIESVDVGALIITNAEATLTLGGLLHVYNGSPRAASVTTSPAGLAGVTVTYDGNSSPPVNAGSYAVVASLNNPNYTAESATGTLVISQASAAISLTGLTAVYDGSAKTVTATTEPAGLSGVTVTYDGSPTGPSGAGSYAVVATLANANYSAPDATGTLVISQASASIALSGLSFTYDGSAKSVTAVTTPANLTGLSITYDGSSTPPTNAGSYQVVAALANPNYDAENATATLTIRRASAAISLNGLSATYDGSPKPATATTDPPGISGVSVTYNGSTSAPTNAGSYAVVASLNNGNYDAPNATGSLVIDKATATIALAGLTATYDGSAKSVTASTNPAGIAGLSVTYNGSPAQPIDAGSYAVVASLTNDNYNAADATGAFVIGKATASISLSGLAATYDGSPKAVGASTNPSNLTGVVVTYNGAMVAPANAGSYAIVAALTHVNYQAPQATGTQLIEKASQLITFAPLPNKVFGDPPFTVQATASSGLPVSFSAGPNCTASGTTVTITAGGLCTVTASHAGDGNYKPAPAVSQTFGTSFTWSDVLQPVNRDGSSVFKLGSTIPVKFQLTGASAQITTLAARIYVTPISNGILGSEVEAASTAQADSGNVFRYDPVGAQYIFNLSTKGLSQGTWQIRIDLLDGVNHPVIVSLRR